MAQARADVRARRPKPSVLSGNDRLREHIQDRLSRKHSPEQISQRLRLDFPDEPEMWVSHETIYRALYVQGRGALSREVVRCLRTGRALRKPRRRTAERRGRIANMVNISQRPAEADDRAVPGHWEGDRATWKSHVRSGYTDWRLKFDEGVTRSSVEWIVPASACVMGDRGVRSPGKKPKGSRSIRGLRARGRPDG